MLSISDQLVDTDDMKDAKIEDKRSLHNRTIAKVFMNLDDDILWKYIFCLSSFVHWISSFRNY